MSTMSAITASRYNPEWSRPTNPAFEKYKNIGVRIEDDMLVTESGTEWMTKNLPRKMSEIEDFMARASKEVNTTALEKSVNPSLAVYDLDANLLQTALTDAGLFDWQNSLNGKTVRRGWVWGGKNAAY